MQRQGSQADPEGSQVALEFWGPIKITINEQTVKLWGKLSDESIRRTLAALGQSETRTNVGKLCKPSKR